MTLTCDGRTLLLMILTDVLGLQMHTSAMASSPIAAPFNPAQALIGSFEDAWKKGLEPEDYNASRWDGRLLHFCHFGSEFTPAFLT
jgi:hypothetical protein